MKILRTKTGRTLVGALAALLILLIPAMYCGALTIKAASLAPEGSPWHRALQKIAVEWDRISDGQVQLKIYAGGIAGDETDTIRKMRINQIQAALVTGKGLAYIHPDFYVYQLPFVARTDEELDYLFRRLQPVLEDRLLEKGFVLLAFSQSGWLRFFANREATTPEEMRKLKLFSLEGHESIDQAMKAMGFRIVPLKANDVFAALQSGMVEAFAAAPLVAASMQWFTLAPHMNDFYWTPLTGGLIITRRAWNMIPSKLHSRIRKSTERILDELYVEALEVETNAIEVMKKHGLVIHAVPGDAVDQWQRLAVQGSSVLIGDEISSELYHRALAILREFRIR